MVYSGANLLDADALLNQMGVTSGWVVADLGCGSIGHFVFPASRLVGGAGRVYAVDVAKEALDSLKRRALAMQIWNLQTVWSDLEEVPTHAVPANSVDLSIIANVLHVVDEPEAILSEAMRMTKPDGLILILEWKKEPTLLGPELDDRLHADEIEAFLAVHPVRQTRFETGDHHVAWACRKEGCADDVRVLSLSAPMSSD